LTQESKVKFAVNRRKKKNSWSWYGKRLLKTSQHIMEKMIEKKYYSSSVSEWNIVRVCVLCFYGKLDYQDCDEKLENILRTESWLMNWGHRGPAGKGMVLFRIATGILGSNLSRSTNFSTVIGDAISL
jgi:hypothetical protein